MAASSHIFGLLLLCQLLIPHGNAAVNQIPTLSTLDRQNINVQRAVSTELSTCGYLDGDPNNIRTAELGFNCRINTRNGLWGFCTTTAIAVTDCRMAGSCEDRYGCLDGCGLPDEGLYTTTCANSLYCSMAILTFGVDQTYSFIACGDRSVTEHFYITPTIDATTTSASSEADKATSTQTSTTDPTNEASSSGTVGDSSRDENNPSKETSSPPIGAIVGGIIGGLVLICGTIVAVVYLRRRGRNQQPSEPAMSQPAPSQSPRVS